MKRLVSTFLASIILNTGVSYANTLNNDNTFNSTNSINYIEKISFSNENSSNKVLETTIFGLPQNMGPIDRSIRAVIAAGLIGTGIYGITTNNLNRELSIALIGVSIIPIATASTGYCPLYQLVGVQYTF